MNFKCQKCDESLDKLTLGDGGVEGNIFVKDNDGTVNLYFCNSRDCVNRGITIAILNTPKEG